MGDEEKRVFLQEMQDQLSLSRAMVYNIMNYVHGTKRNATPHQLRVFAEYFDCQIEDLLIPAPTATGTAA